MVKNFTSAKKNDNKELFNLVNSNMIPVGNKKFANIPLSLLYIDAAYQREATASMAKINSLAAHWDDKKMDPIKVSARPDEGVFAVLDGFHRAAAAHINGKQYIEAEVLTFDDVDTRLVSEATIFATQKDDVETLTPAQKHNANVVRGIKANVILNKAIQKYHVQLKSNTHGKGKTGTLSGFAEALRMADVYGYQMVDDVFNIICSSRWDSEPNGFGNVTLAALKNVLSVHADLREQIIPATINYFRTITPNTMLAFGKTKYAIRSDRAAMTLAYDDFLNNTLGIPMAYKVEDNKMVMVA